MSKRIHCLLFLSILLTLLLLLPGCDAIHTIYIGELESAHIIVPEGYALDGDLLAQITEPDELSAIAAALKPGEAAISGGFGQPYIITLYYQRATEEYEVYINDDALIFAFEDSKYAASAENANALLAFPAFTGWYIMPLLTKLNVGAGGESFPLEALSYSINVFAPSGKKSAAAKQQLSSSPLLVVADLGDIVISGVPTDATLETTYFNASGVQVDEPEEAGAYSCAAMVNLASSDVSGTLSYRFDFMYEPPFSAIISADSTEQSGAFAVLLKNTNPNAIYTLNAEFREDEIAFSSLGKNIQIALIGVSASQKTGEYILDVLEDSLVIASFSIEIANKDFPKQYLTVDVDQAAMRTDPGNAASDARKTAAARANPEPTLLCDGSFIIPAEGRISTEFGEERYLNGVFSNRHAGLDIAADENSPVRATARGKVVFADELILSGNTIIIDHGAGVFSTYCHQNEFRCTVGDIVEQGDTIGLVGSTGFSTGPHLHWSISLHGTNINPLALVESSQILTVIAR